MPASTRGGAHRRPGRGRPGRGRPGRGRTGPGRGTGRPVDPTRRAAFDVLHAVSERSAYANLALPGALREHRLSGRDAAFATELTHGALRRQGTYDAVLTCCVDRPLARLDSAVLDVLRLGAHQLLAMRVATHAAVATTVDLADDVAGRGAAGLVNAVLRKVAARDLEGWLAELAPADETDPMRRRALVHSHPRWIVEAFAEALGERAVDELDDALAADNDPAEVSLVCWPGRSTVAELVEDGARPGRHSPYAVTIEGDPQAYAAVAERRAGVQDEGSQLVTHALAATPLDGPDRRWLDLCAGPGGKAALLAGLAAERDARLLAAELQPHRAALVRRALQPATSPERASAPANEPGVLGVVCADGTSPVWPDGAFDRVLLDAPCTGLGALRRRPEARWRRSPEDVETLQRVQRDLLATALRAVRSGGLVAYVTCSPHRAETADVVADAPATVELLDAQEYVAGALEFGPGPTVQLWPHLHGTDAMYFALLQRR